ncbi:MAG: hypothetical protein ABEJ22_02950 [Haloferacaceae archaeon]
MSDDAPDRPPTTNLLLAVNFPRNAKVGVVVGVVFAVAVYFLRVVSVLGDFTGPREYPVFGPEGWYLMLAFVLASATALLVTTVLTLASAYRLTRSLAADEEPERHE